MHTQGLGHGRACFRALQQPIGERAPVEDDQMASRSLRSRRMISDAGSPSTGALVATRLSISSSVGRAASWSSSPRRYSPSKRSTRVSDPSLSDSDAMAREPLDSGLHDVSWVPRSTPFPSANAVLTKRLARRLVELDRATLDLDVGSLSDAEASDRLSRHVAGWQRWQQRAVLQPPQPLMTWLQQTSTYLTKSSKSPPVCYSPCCDGDRTEPRRRWGVPSRHSRIRLFSRMLPESRELAMN